MAQCLQRGSSAGTVRLDKGEESMRKEVRVSSEIFKWISEDGELQVCAVFSEAAYLAEKEGRMLLLHDSSYGLVPFGAGMTELSLFLQKTKLQVGQKAIRKGLEISFPGTDICLELKPEEPEHRKVWCPERKAVEEAAARGKRMLLGAGNGLAAGLWPEECGNEWSEEDLFIKAGLPSLHKLSEALREKSREGILESLLGLLGLGRGLTPTMDDFLTGLMYAFGYRRDCWQSKLPEAEMLAEAVEKLAPERTNPYSLPYLQASARGLYFSCLEKVLNPAPEQLAEEAVTELLRRGSSSGSDMLAGIIFGLEYNIVQTS